MTGIIVDNFAGGGGASTGIEAALGRAVDIAINHDEQAIRMHEANHPGTMHIRNNIWQIDPRDVVRGRHVDLAWFSPDCKHFSKAKGGKPREKSIRDLAWVVVMWAERVRPDVILLENVEEFRTWGPLCKEGKPIKERAGETFDKWCKALRKAGYRLQWKELRACDYGAPTIRKRLFMIARCDGKPIVWPKPTHGKPGSTEVLSGQRKPWRTAAEIIDWSIPCPSIFERKKPLAEKTLRRIAHGIMKFVVNNPAPFVVPICNTNWAGDRFYPGDEPLRTITTAKGGEMAVVMPHITKFRSGAIGHAADEPLHTVTANSFVKRPGGSAPLGLVEAVVSPVVVGCGGRRGQSGPTGPEQPYPTTTTKADACVVAAFMQKFAQNGQGVDLGDPLHTVMAGAPRHAVVASSLVKLRGTCRDGQSVETPLHTVSAGGTHMGEVRAFLLKYYSAAQHGQELDEPLHTITHQARFGLVTVTIEGEEYVIVDIGMRMLTPRELFNAQGFPADYQIDTDAHGAPITKTAQVAKCGNSVCPPIAEALVRANMADEIAEQEVKAA
jgi:DNA (cytosine-5)-methyltransferase 1